MTAKTTRMIQRMVIIPSLPKDARSLLPSPEDFNL